MKLWCIDFSFLNTMRLFAYWRELFLARKVLHGIIEGYRHHPHLIRFKGPKNLFSAINRYIQYIFLESRKRSYSFNENKLEYSNKNTDFHMPVTAGQSIMNSNFYRQSFPWEGPKNLARINRIINPSTNQLFIRIEGDIESWKRTKNIKV